MASGLSDRGPAGAMVPFPVVVIQCMVRLGPAWKTVPPVHPKSQAWLSARYTPAGSAVRIGSDVTPGSLDHEPVAPPGVKSSPSLWPARSYQEPPRVKTWPVDSGVSPSYARGIFISGPRAQASVAGS